MSIYTLEFWKSAGERAVKTLAQSIVASVTVLGVPVGFQDINWIAVASIAGVAAVISILTSIISAGATGDISLTRSEYIAPTGNGLQL